MAYRVTVNRQKSGASLRNRTTKSEGSCYFAQNWLARFYLYGPLSLFGTQPRGCGSEGSPKPGSAYCVCMYSDTPYCTPCTVRCQDSGQWLGYRRFMQTIRLGCLPVHRTIGGAAGRSRVVLLAGEACASIRLLYSVHIPTMSIRKCTSTSTVNKGQFDSMIYDRYMHYVLCARVSTSSGASRYSFGAMALMRLFCFSSMRA